MEPKSTSKVKFQIVGLVPNSRQVKVSITTVLTILALVIGGGVLMSKGSIFASKKSSYFTVVLDCGSTGTRVNVYEWIIGNGNKTYGNLPFCLHSYPEYMTKTEGCQYHCMQTEPGLHNFFNNASGVKASLDPLVNYAKKWVPLGSRGATPIFVLATAGMRRLEFENAKRVLEDVENVVKEHGFLYRKSWIRILTGKEEAYYGWVALNYKLGVFGNSLSGTLGLLDLGGSSLQVVAEVNDFTEQEYVLTSKIGSVSNSIAAYSLRAFGLNEAFDRTISMLSHTQALRESVSGLFEVRHPCLGSGFMQNYTCDSCFGPDSRTSVYFSNQIQGDKINTLYLVGEPNLDQCKVIARAAAINSSNLESSRQSDDSNCIGVASHGGSSMLHQTNVQRYHALSAFFAVYNVVNVSGRANLTLMWEKGLQLCSRLWLGQISLDEHYCFRVLYMASLIENALCLSHKEIIFGPGDVSWTLGAALVESEFLWHNAYKSRHGILTFGNTELFPPILLFLLLLSLLLIVYFCQIKLPMPSRKLAAPGISLPSYLRPKRQPN